MGRRSSSRPVMPGAEPEGIEDLRELILTVLLALAGVIVIASALLPGFLRGGRWPLLMMMTIGAVLLVSSGASRRWGIPVRAVLPIALAGDLVVRLASLAVARPDNSTSNIACLGILCLFAAVFGTARDLICQVTLSNLVLVDVVVAGQADWQGRLMLVLWTDFAAVLPAYTMFSLRQRLMRSNALARDLARTDPLTRALNRRGLADQAPLVVAAAHDAATGVGVLVCDLDHFKRLNDTFGHAVGDEALTIVAGALRRSAREGDVVARLGGEEFAVVAALAASDLTAMAERIRSEIAEVCSRWNLTVSIGASWSPVASFGGTEGVKVVWALLDEADDWAYVAKDEGRDRVRHALLTG